MSDLTLNNKLHNVIMNGIDKCLIADENQYIMPLDFYMSMSPTKYFNRATHALPESTPNCKLPIPINIIFNNPATIVYWEDGTKTIVKIMEGDVYDEIIGVAMAYTKKLFGSNTDFKNMVKGFYPKPKVIPEPVKVIVKKKKPIKQTNLENKLDKLVQLLSKNISNEIKDDFDDTYIYVSTNDKDNVAGEVITDEG